MSDVSDDTMTATAPRYTRRLSDKILIAFHQACDQADFEVAERPLKVVETVLAVPRETPIDRSGVSKKPSLQRTSGFGNFGIPTPGRSVEPGGRGGDLRHARQRLSRQRRSSSPIDAQDRSVLRVG